MWRFYARWPWRRLDMPRVWLEVGYLAHSIHVIANPCFAETHAHVLPADIAPLAVLLWEGFDAFYCGSRIADA